jgi:hypothetical protein
VVIEDDGKGFASRDEIERFFRTFGTPHEEGDATYGRFRMGRGQMFAFGINRWRTNVFQMDVDIKTKGLDFHLQEVPGAAAKGCRIEIGLYDEMLPSECDSVQRDLKQWVAFVPTPVYLNGRLISQDPADMKWDVETDEARFKLAPTKGTLSIYNLGVLVAHAPAHRFGTGGVVVSKQRLDVNFARNDVQNTCRVFARIKAELRKHSDSATSKKRLTDHERQHMAIRIAEGTIDAATGLDIPVLTDVEGRHYSLRRLANRLYQASKLVAAPRGSRQAIKVAQQHLATVLSDETLDRFDAEDMPELLAKLRAVTRQWAEPRNWQVDQLRHALDTAQAADLGQFDAVVQEGYDPVPEKELDARQKLLRRVIEAGMYPVAKATGQMPRTIAVGRSDVADAWTDGVGHVWVNVNLLPLIGEGHQGCIRLAALLVHEFMHEGPDTDTHEHDADFYKRHHDLAIDTDVIGRSVAAMMRYLATDARKQGKKPTRGVGIFEDMEARIIREGGSGSAPAGADPEDETVLQDMAA